MAKPITIFRASSGLNVVVDPARLTFDPDTGVSALSAAYNITHDQTGRPSRRKGYDDTAITESCHSVFCEGGEALAAIGTSLCLIAPDLSGYRVLATITDGARVSYAQVDDTIFWVNGFEKGYVRNGANNSWVRGTYYGPTSLRRLSDPPIGTIVFAFNGRIYIVQGKALFYSDPFSLNAFDLARGFIPFEGQVTMARPVAGGVFVGTSEGAWFLAGTDAVKFQLVKISGSPVIAGTDAKVDFNTIGLDQLLQGRTGEGVIWTSTAGIYLGTADGMVFNLTKDKLTERSATEGAALIIDGNYVVTLNP